MQSSDPAGPPGPGPEAIPEGPEVTIDGSEGEGGGQILRTSLSLSLRTGTAFRLVNVRANRDRPGLRPQHLAAVTAAARLGAAQVTGDRVGSTELRFAPQLHGAQLPPGDYRFDIGTAGSAPLVLQTVLPALLGASGPSRVTILGGTYNTKAPPFDFIARAFAPLVRQLGGGLAVRMDSPGFYPAGGGQIFAEIEPCHLLGREPRLEHLDAFVGIVLAAIVSGVIDGRSRGQRFRSIPTAPKTSDAPVRVALAAAGTEPHRRHTDPWNRFGHDAIAMLRHFFARRWNSRSALSSHRSRKSFASASGFVVHTSDVHACIGSSPAAAS